MNQLTIVLQQTLLASIDRAIPASRAMSFIVSTIGRPRVGRVTWLAADDSDHVNHITSPGREWRIISVIRVNFLPEFHFGDDAVLLTLDGKGAEELEAALSDVQRDASSRLEHDGVVHEFPH